MSKRILITGGCGYIGSQLLKTLDQVDEKLTIRILDNFSTGSHNALKKLPKNHSYELIEGDILNPHLLQTILHQVDTVIHLAACVSTPMAFGNLQMIEQVNNWGTTYLMDSAIANKVKHFIHISSTAVFGPTIEGSPISSNKPFGAYATSKFNAEKGIEVSAKRGVPSTILRLASVYGDAPSLRFDSVFNKFAFLAGTSKPITIYGDGKQSRPGIHVKDAAEAILFCLQNPEKTVGKKLNVFENNFQINEIANTLSEIVKDVKIRYVDQDIRTRYSFAVTEPSMASLVNLKPKYTLKIGMQELIEQFNNFKPIF